VIDHLTEKIFDITQRKPLIIPVVVDLKADEMELSLV
jgi:hypothetical protein